MSVGGMVGLGILWFIISIFKSGAKRGNSTNKSAGKSDHNTGKGSVSESIFQKIKEFSETFDVESENNQSYKIEPDIADVRHNMQAAERNSEEEDLYESYLSDENLNKQSDSLVVAKKKDSVKKNDGLLQGNFPLKQAVIWSEILGKPVSMR